MKRRDFLKSMAVTGAAASAAELGVIPKLFSPRRANAAGRNKLVFISDLHMNVASGYSWLVNNAVDLARFLDTLNNRDDVAELIILGDLVDDWVLPVEHAPWTFADILGANYNNGVVPALQAVCANTNITVTYVTGNHDMLSWDPKNKDVLFTTFPDMNVISDEPGLGAYVVEPVIWAEHGHRYTLFNAPDTWSRAGGHLPLGYFISRLAASKSLSDGKVTTSPDLLDQFVKAPSEINNYLNLAGLDQAVGDMIDDAFIIAVFNAIALWAGYWPWDNFKMQNLDDYPDDPFVEDIALAYDTIFSGWPERQNIVDHFEAVLNDLGFLNSAANLLFEMPERIRGLYPFTPRIVLFGHTHQAAFQYHAGEVETIYANTGTWIDGKPMTWVEVDIDEAGAGVQQYTVALWFNGESTPRQSASVTVQTDAPGCAIRHR
jgi:UDP-2,3-diacylglucosamine pyrophosphatase LpxH